MKKLTLILVVIGILHGVSYMLQAQTVEIPGQEGGQEHGGEEGGGEEPPVPTPPEREPVEPVVPVSPEEGPQPVTPPEEQPTVPVVTPPPIEPTGPTVPVTGGGPEKDFASSLTEVQSYVASASNLESAPARITELIDSVRSIDGDSNLGLAPQDQVSAITNVLDVISKTQTLAEQTQAAKKEEPTAAQKQTWGSWFWSASTTVVSTSVALIAGGALEAVEYLLPFYKISESLQLTAQYAQSQLKDAIFDSINLLDFPTQDSDYTEQQALIADYQSYLTKYQINAPELSQALSAYASDLTNRQTFAESVQQLQSDVKAVSSSAPVADQLAQLAALYDRAQVLSRSSSEFTADLASQVETLTSSLKTSFSSLADTASARLDILNQATQTTAGDVVAEVQSIVDRLNAPSAFEILSNDKVQPLRDKAATTLSNLTKLSQRQQLETLLLGGNLKSFNASSDTQRSYADRIQSAYQGIMDLYDETMYDRQSSLLLKLIDALKTSKQLESQKQLLSMISDRYREIKSFDAKKAAQAKAVNQLDTKLNLKSKIPSDQMRAMQGEFLQQDYGIDPSKWPSQTKSQTLDVIESYKLFEENDQANNLQTFLQSTGLTKEELTALASGAGTATAADLGGLAKGEFDASLQTGFTSLLSKALEAIESSIGKKLTSLGLWFINFGGGFRYKSTVETVGGIAKAVSDFAKPIANVLNSETISRALPVSLAGKVELVTAIESGARGAAGTAEALAAGKVGWADWLGSKLQSLGSSMVAKGEKLTGTGIDVNSLLAKATAQEAAIKNDASITTALINGAKSFVSSLIDSIAGVTVNYEANLNTARQDFETARMQFRDFLGVDESMTPQQFNDAFKSMVAKISYRGYSDGEAVSLLTTKFMLLSRALETSSRNLASAYQDIIANASVAANLFDAAAGTSFDFKVSQAFNAQPDVLPQDVVEAAIGVTAAQEALQTTLVSNLRNSLQSVQSDITSSLAKARTSPFNAANVDAYTRILSELLLQRQRDITEQFTAARTRMLSAVGAFQKQVGTAS